MWFRTQSIDPRPPSEICRQCFLCKPNKSCLTNWHVEQSGHYRKNLNIRLTNYNQFNNFLLFNNVSTMVFSSLIQSETIQLLNMSIHRVLQTFLSHHTITQTFTSLLNPMFLYWAHFLRIYFFFSFFFLLLFTSWRRQETAPSKILQSSFRTTLAGPVQRSCPVGLYLLICLTSLESVSISVYSFSLLSYVLLIQKI